MATLIVYMSQHGCSEKATQLLVSSLSDDITLVRLDGVPDPDLTRFDRVIIGGSIHMGEIQRGIRKYCERNMDELLKRRVGLFLCCMFEGDVARKQFEAAFPPELIGHATVTGLFGGEISFDKMTALEQMIVKKVAKIDHDVSRLNVSAIKEFARTFKGEE